MLTLAVLADDLTGALDTGVQFAASGVKTALTIGLTPPADCTVSICDLETRHVTPRRLSPAHSTPYGTPWRAVRGICM